MPELTKKNANYACSIVKLDKFEPIPKADNLKIARIYGNSVIVSVDTKPGDTGLFFPVECQLDHKFLTNNNLYRKTEHGNVDPMKVGYFDLDGRIKCLKIRGARSEGIFLPLSSLDYLGVDLANITPVCQDFDTIDGQEICRKYIPKRNKVGGVGGGKQARKARVDDLIVTDQFRLHTDTANLRRNSHIIKSETMVQISDKLHGTSGVFANILTYKSLPWYLKILQQIGIPIKDTQYALAWSSRNVVKGVGENSKPDAVHYYKEDVWAHTADKFIKNKLPAGYTIYGEIVGYTPSGGAIQSCKDVPYSYGCEPGESALYVYRVTNTNADGMVLELNRDQRIAFAERYGFTLVPELYYGRADGLMNPSELLEYELAGTDFGESFVETCELKWVRDQDCPRCANGLPAEGVVVAIDHFDRVEALKLKSFRFLKNEGDQLDAGVIDLETEQSEETVEA